MIYILDTYNKYARNKNVVRTFFIRNQQYCIRQVPLEWGIPIFPEKEDDKDEYKIYEKLDDALNFIVQLNTIN